MRVASAFIARKNGALSKRYTKWKSVCYILQLNLFCILYKSLTTATFTLILELISPGTNLIRWVFVSNIV